MPILIEPKGLIIEDEEKGEEVKPLVIEKKEKKRGFALLVAGLLSILFVLVVVSESVFRKGLNTKKNHDKEDISDSTSKEIMHIPAQSRPYYHGSDVRAACIKNDDDERFISICPKEDERAWCSRPERTGPDTNFFKLCAKACEDPNMAWAMPCAWQAIANLDKVCDGTFVAQPPSSSQNIKNNEDWIPANGRMQNGVYLYECDEHAVCSSCFNNDDQQHGDGEHCERVAAHYSGYGQIDSWYDKAFDATGAEAAFFALRDLDQWCQALKANQEETSFSFSSPTNKIQPAWVEGYSNEDSGEYVQHSGVIGGELVEEHIILSSHNIQIQNNQESRHDDESVYTYWHYVLSQKFSLDITTHIHTSSSSLEKAFNQHRVAPGALVFLDIQKSMDNDNTFFSSHEQAFSSQNLPLNIDCTYIYTDNILLRSSLLRTALGYDQPVTLILTGDIFCRLSIPITHHQIIFAHSAGLVSLVENYNNQLSKNKATPPKALWFPSGLPHARVLSDPQASSLDFASTGAWLATPPIGIPLEDKKYFYFGNEEIINFPHAKGAGQLPFFCIKQNDIQIDFTKSTRESVFTLCPSHRILETLMLNSIPIVHLDSSGTACQDPFAFWLEGTQDFKHEAPFIFVQDMKTLSQLLQPYAENPAKLNRLYTDLAAYRNNLEQYLATLPLHLSRSILSQQKHETQPAKMISTCSTLPLTSEESADLNHHALTYYANPNWLYSSPQLLRCSASRVSSQFSSDSHVVPLLCFSHLCAPPLVQSFTCSFVPMLPPAEDDQEYPELVFD
uniref:Exostosin GT47 domain-containing protein n=1 Tax=Aureoumbra lagunensis TaxID=44058 RepID=A0A7S3K7B1_9STRA